LIDVTDMNGDSLPDLVIQNGPGTVAIAYNHPGPGTIAGGMTVQPEPSEQTKPITLTLTLVVAQGKAAPTGTVSFGLDGFQITTLPVTGTVMTYVYTNTGNLELGKHIFSAVYSGDSNYQPGSFAVKHTMVPLQLATAINLSASATTSLTGQAVVFTAKVTAISGTKIPFGMIAFHDGQTNLGTRYLDNNGVAVFDTGLLQIGTHTITAVFAANPYFGASQSNPVTVQINSVTTSISLAAIPNPAPAGSAVQLTAQVSSLSGVPNGAVTFYDGTTALETRTVGSDGIASLGTTFTSGTHSLSASYAANGMWGGSSSGLTVTSNVAGSSSSVLDGKADFAVKLSAYEGVASRGVPYQMDVKVRALWGFKEDVHLTCAVSDPGAECNFEHPVLTNASGASRLTVLLKSAVAGAEVHKSNHSGRSAMPILATLLGVILLAPTRKLRQRLLALLSASVLLFSLACGQGATPPGGTVKVTVTAASGTGQAATIHSEVVNVKIKTF
jgi:predicted thioesterase